MGNNGAGPYAAVMTVTRGSLVLDYSHTRLTGALIGQYKPVAVCRYVLGAARDQGKGLKAAEADQLGAWGLPILCNFEYATNPVLTAAQGAADARDAQGALVAAGMPSSSPVVFSMDEDLSIGQIPDVLRYWAGAQGVLGWGAGLDGTLRPRAGLYGEYDLIERAGPAGVHWCWQASAWSRGLLSKYALLYQVQNNFIPGYDRNIAQAADFGQRFSLGYGDTMELSDRIKVGSRYDQWPPEMKVKPDTEFTVEELLLQGAARPAALQSAFAAATRAEVTRDGTEAQAVSDLGQLVRALGSGAVDVNLLAQQLLAVLAPAQAIALSDVLRKTHLTVDGS